ncbi:thioredoxin family protein [Tepidibacillus infernus]|uniref:Thioredoxin-like fold domain-containing protein n=1 Tax=Tepidibacillus decaturensis TaxID=1413211 RepID=A0A135L524_9BACI|nr:MULTISPECIES: thioredoxin family protein [Tepidibacillus]KXG44088.1 hypothetical protein U473_08800 [Tepidibacillus decaturensis]GBF10485.1 hypothetical protein HK1_00497 [Tepidibacillus sp. HK-1]
MLEIKILGMGCKNCVRLQKEVEAIMEENQLKANIQKIQDVPGIMKYGIMSTPGLVINEKVKSFGRIPKREEILQYIKEEL